MTEMDSSLVVYSNEEEIPETVKALCAFTGESEKVTKTFNLGTVTCFRSRHGDKAFFRNEVVENLPNGRVFLPWEDSPIIMKISKKMVAIALPLNFSQDAEAI